MCVPLSAVDGWKKSLSTAENLRSAGIDLTHRTHYIPSSKKEVCNKNVGGESDSLSLRRNLNQCLRSCVKCRSSRRQCVRSIVSSLVQSGGDLPVKCPLIHTKLSCRVAFSLSSVTNSFHRSASPSLFNCLSPCKRPVAIPPTVVRLLTPRHNERATLKKTPQPALRNLASCLQTPDHATTLSLIRFSRSNLPSAGTFLGKVLQLTNSGCAQVTAWAQATAQRKIPHLEVHGGHAKRS